MKSLLLIVTSLFAYNENMNFYDRTDLLFTQVGATFVPQAKTYYYSYIHYPSEMDVQAFTSFKNGSEKLIYEIPSSLNVDISKRSEFFIEVNSTKYYFEQELGYITNNYFSIPNFFDFNYTTTTTIGIQIPSLDSQAVTNYNNELNKSNLYTKEAFKQMLLGNDYFNGYEDGEYAGYNWGYEDGLVDGYSNGYEDGEDAGYLQALAESEHPEGQMLGIFAILSSGFASLASILAIELFPGFTLGLLLFLPVIFGIAYVLLKFLLGGTS